MSRLPRQSRRRQGQCRRVCRPGEAAGRHDPQARRQGLGAASNSGGGGRSGAPANQRRRAKGEATAQANAGAAQLTGYSKDYVVGTSVLDLLVPEYRESVGDVLRRAAEQGHDGAQFTLGSVEPAC